MSESKNILTSVPKHKHREPAIETNWIEFEKVIRSRRSVRVYTDEKIPNAVVEKCLDMALIAPNSSNLQSWEFHRVITPEKKMKLVEACLGQNTARSAAELIVCVARTNTWRSMAKQNVAYYKSKNDSPKSVFIYYEKLVYLAYIQGPLSILTPIKKLIFWGMGLFQPTLRGPASHADMRVWAHKSTALACENLMLAFRAAGYDSCPMEGFDEARVSKLLNLPCGAEVCMVISAGKRAENGVYGPQIRFSREQFVKNH